jgi:hypothetical protein
VAASEQLGQENEPNQLCKIINFYVKVIINQGESPLGFPDLIVRRFMDSEAENKKKIRELEITVAKMKKDQQKSKRRKREDWEVQYNAEN